MSILNSVGRTVTALALTGCCFGGLTTPAAPGTDPTAVPGAVPAVPGVVAPAVPGTAVAGSVTSTVTLAPGFLPDPNVTMGVAGGPNAAGALNPSCRGSIPAAPSVILNATAPFANLRVLVNSTAADTTLVIRHPDGTYTCDDDSGGNRNPVVQGPFAAGQHQIFVGIFAGAGEVAPFTLGITELPTLTPQSLGVAAAAAMPVAPPAMPIVLAPGFVPDPNTSSGRAGGPVDASTLDVSCRGFIAAAPNHVLTAAGSFAKLRVIASAGVDTTLVIRRPDGTLVCNDDSEGWNPIVEASFAPGAYQIFVGTYSAATAGAPYNLGITELSSVTAATLGTPPAM